MNRLFPIFAVNLLVVAEDTNRTAAQRARSVLVIVATSPRIDAVVSTPRRPAVREERPGLARRSVAGAKWESCHNAADGHGTNGAGEPPFPD